LAKRLLSRTPWWLPPAIQELVAQDKTGLRASAKLMGVHPVNGYILTASERDMIEHATRMIVVLSFSRGLRATIVILEEYMSTISELGNNIAEMEKSLRMGGGAQFFAYVSPQNNTEQAVTQWVVKIEQTDGNWSGTITSENPTQELRTPNLSGVFKVTVTASGPKFQRTQLTPTPDSKPDVGCNSNCAAMVGIVATPDGSGANYWATWNAVCSPQAD
jgi:hypothetical protein